MFFKRYLFHAPHLTCRRGSPPSILPHTPSRLFAQHSACHHCLLVGTFSTVSSAHTDSHPLKGPTHSKFISLPIICHPRLLEDQSPIISGLSNKNPEKFIGVLIIWLSSLWPGFFPNHVCLSVAFTDILTFTVTRKHCLS